MHHQARASAPYLELFVRFKLIQRLERLVTFDKVPEMTVGGVLVEIPGMLTLAGVANRTRH